MNANPYPKYIAMVAFLLLLPIQSIAQLKTALVIGNSDYRFSPLTNPNNDAEDMAAALRELGFDVADYKNLDRKLMRQAIREFGKKLNRGGIGLFYFAGHGVQIKGRNYLIPLGTDITVVDEVEDESIDAALVLRKMESAGNDVNIVILDACRNNPFARSFRNLELGLARMEGPVGSIIAYATAPGSVALDGDGRNGVYTKHFLKALKKPGLSIEETFKMTRNGVRLETKGKQIPWESSSLTGNFKFLPSISEPSGQAKIITPPSPRPGQFIGHLRINTNVPKARIYIDKQNIAKTDQARSVTVENIKKEIVEVVVESEGFRPMAKQVQLTKDQWQQVDFALIPIQPNQVAAVQSQQRNRESSCLQQNQRAAIAVRLEFDPFGKATRKAYESTFVSATLANSFEQKGIAASEVHINQGLRISRSPDPLKSVMAYAKKNGAAFAVLMSITGKEIPIKAVRTNMRTTQGKVVIRMADVKTGQLLGRVTEAFNQPGIEWENSLEVSMQRLIPTLTDKLLERHCY